MTEQKTPANKSRALAMGDPNTMDATKLAEFISAVIEDGLSGALSVEHCKSLEQAAGKRLQLVTMQLFELGRHRGSAH
jgi:hypothetical protein